MEDGRLPISNNECEACIHPFATGYKSRLFADTLEGARASGIIYSQLESAKLNQLDVFRYLSYLLEKMQGIDYQYQNEPHTCRGSGNFLNAAGIRKRKMSC
jgi:transposase